MARRTRRDRSARCTAQSLTTGNIDEDDSAAIATVMLPTGQVFAGFSSGGTITVTSSSEGNVEVSFNFQVHGFDPNTQLEVTVTVSGTFDAIDNNVDFPGFQRGDPLYAAGSRNGQSAVSGPRGLAR